MAKKTFTDETSIRQIKKANKPVEYFYAGKQRISRPLGVRVSPKNKKTFFIVYYADGKTKKYTLGVFPALSLADAKKLANEYADRDPVAEKAQAKADAEAARIAADTDKLEKMSQRTMNDLWEKYSSLTKTKQKAINTQREEARKWRVDIEPVLGAVAVKDITPEMIDNLLERLAKKSPVAANRLYSLLRVMFKPALKGGWISIHPMQWLEKPVSEAPRKRVLTDDEIKTILTYLENTESNAGDILKIILLTCQRPGEVCSMRWGDVDLDNRLWRQETNKTGVVNLVPISDQVFEILSARDRTSEWVFPSKGAHTRNTGWARGIIQRESGIQGWTAHDLRRTGRTIMSRLRIDQHIRERVLNHAQGGVTGVYDQYDYLKEKRIALAKLGRELDRITGKAVKAEVVQIRRAG